MCEVFDAYFHRDRFQFLIGKIDPKEDTLESFQSEMFQFLIGKIDPEIRILIE